MSILSLIATSSSTKQTHTSPTDSTQSFRPRLNPPLKQPNQLIQSTDNNIRPRIHLQLLLALAADKDGQSSCFVARNNVVDTIADHYQGKRGWR